MYIYKSFGVKEFLFPKVNNKISNLTNSNYLRIYKKIRTKEDILDIAIDKIKLGDLIYDSYLTRNKRQKPTIDIKSKDFQIFLKRFFKIIFLLV